MSHYVCCLSWRKINFVFIPVNIVQPRPGRPDMDDVEMSEVGAGGGAEAGAPEEEKVMADSGVAATVSVSLHPLVIMNISEHWTRSVLAPHT